MRALQNGRVRGAPGVVSEPRVCRERHAVDVSGRRSLRRRRRRRRSEAVAAGQRAPRVVAVVVAHGDGNKVGMDRKR